MNFKIDLYNGKYTYIFQNGVQKALRYGEPWREDDLVGDNLVFALACEVNNLQEELDKAIEVIEDSGVEYSEALEAKRGEY